MLQFGYRMPFPHKQYIPAAGALAVCALLAFVTFGALRATGSQPAAVSQAVVEPMTHPASDGLRRYENAVLHFSLLYPEDLRVLEYDEGGGAHTITFENPGDGRGFQVYVTLYDGSEIAPKLIERDTASGAMQNVTSATVAGVSAIAFSSTNPIMGDIYEVWIVRDGLLYEIVTYQPFDVWLLNILTSWNFF